MKIGHWFSWRAKPQVSDASNLDGSPRLTIEASKIDKLGSFAAEDIARGAFIRHLSGDEVSQREILRRIKKGRLSPDDPLQIATDRFIDLDPASLSINHSCDPNAGVRASNELIALRHIKTGEELTFDYSTTVTSTIEPFDWAMDCACGSPLCRKTIGNVSTLPKSSIQKFIQANALPHYILVELGLK